jgi:multidrug efflux pump subunit AcrA (membrane-fusion protein)
LAYDPSLKLTGKVAYIFPTFRTETRTLRVRFDFPNSQLRLKPGMFADVELQLAPRDALTIPDSAVIDTGTRQLVFIKGASGEYLPREVRLGVHGDRRVEVLSGLNESDELVVEGNFLLDSESRLKAALSTATTGQKSP